MKKGMKRHKGSGVVAVRTIGRCHLVPTAPGQSRRAGIRTTRLNYVTGTRVFVEGAGYITIVGGTAYVGNHAVQEDAP